VSVATILCFAVVVLSWHILWMSRHAVAVSAELREMGQIKYELGGLFGTTDASAHGTLRWRLEADISVLVALR
jgi:hypothetical protein